MISSTIIKPQIVPESRRGWLRKPLPPEIKSRRSPPEKDVAAPESSIDIGKRLDYRAADKTKLEKKLDRGGNRRRKPTGHRNATTLEPLLVKRESFSRELHRM
ncbi:hypothetical protein Rs2_26501 [Raphanus sativus]|nr:hypothetical protein Rs2_26501 [Raphanus sativus]